MFIQAITYDTAAQFLDAWENVEKETIHAGETAFYPCRTAANEDLYVMFDALGSAAILGDGVCPTLNS